MKKIFLTLAVLIPFHVAQAKDDAKPQTSFGTEMSKLDSEFFGNWVFDKLDYHPHAITGLSSSDEKIVRKFVFDIQANKIVFNGKECLSPKFFKAKAEVSSYYYFIADEKRRPYLPFLKEFFTKTCPKKNGQPFTVDEFKKASETQDVTIVCENNSDFFNGPYGIILLDEDTVFSESFGGYFCMRKNG